MREQPYDDLSLFDLSGRRKYLNAAERHRFMRKAEWTPPSVRLFCLVLGWSGGRISEVLALTPARIDFEVGVVKSFVLSSVARRQSHDKFPCLAICLTVLRAILTCVPASATPRAFTNGFGHGAAQPHGGT